VSVVSSRQSEKRTWSNLSICRSNDFVLRAVGITTRVSTRDSPNNSTTTWFFVHQHHQRGDHSGKQFPFENTIKSSGKNSSLPFSNSTTVRTPLRCPTPPLLPVSRNNVVGTRATITTSTGTTFAYFSVRFSFVDVLTLRRIVTAADLVEILKTK